MGNQPFTWDAAREELNRFREQINQWEQARAQLIQQGGIQ